LKIPDGIDIGETFRLDRVIRGSSRHGRNESCARFSPNGIMSADALTVASSTKWEKATIQQYKEGVMTSESRELEEGTLRFDGTIGKHDTSPS
jgi:hypothetical protein